MKSAARLIRKSVWTDTVKPYMKEAFEAGIADAKRFARLRPAIVEAEVEAWDRR